MIYSVIKLFFQIYLIIEPIIYQIKYLYEHKVKI
jgi:hypothetical protein